MKFAISLALGVAGLLLVSSAARAQTTQSPLPQPTGYVNDYAGVIDRATKEQLETTLTNLDHQQKIQFAVVTVDSTNGQEIYDYSLAVARGWGIGSKDTQKPSLLLLVAIKDRKYFTQVSRHLEGDLPDGLVGQIQREHLVPAFRAGEYGRGLSETIDEYITTVATKNGFSTDTIFAGGRSTPEIRRSPRGNTSICAPLIVVLLVIVILAVLSRRRRGPGGRGGFGRGWLPWLLLNMFMNSGRRGGSSGWSGGGFGGFGGGSSGGSFGGGGFGGFGGGGDFGGGGAGGSW
jgi:uncharacterized protein